MQSSPAPTLSFATAAGFEAWLQRHYTEENGLWIKIAKKSSGISSITYDEALDIALCYGWIDSVRKSYDESYFVQKFTPRRTSSNWSARNIEKVSRLIAEGKMRPSGLTEIEAAKKDGRWKSQ